MKLKTNLHLHTKEDPLDGESWQKIVRYDVYELIDYAHKHDFKVLALTSHLEFIYKEEYGEYAKAKGILLIPGIEIELREIFFEKHVLVLNCDKSIEKIKTFQELTDYKKKHPDIFVIAPHPDFGFVYSIGLKNLRKYIDVFDAIECSWFYAGWFDLNKGSKELAKEFNKPFISTSDTHILKNLKDDYAVIEADGLTIESVFKAIKESKFVNVTKEKKTADLVKYLIKTNSRMVRGCLENSVKNFIFKIYGLSKNWKSS